MSAGQAAAGRTRGAEPNPANYPDQDNAAAPHLQQTVGRTVNQAEQAGQLTVAHQKNQAAGSIGTVARALRLTGQELRNQSEDVVAEWMDRAATEVEHVARNLREQSVPAMIGDVEDFARREPALFLGGAFALGLLATRFLRSAQPVANRNGRSHRQSYRTPAMAPGATGYTVREPATAWSEPASATEIPITTPGDNPAGQSR
jgi:hypothetical protein